MHKFNVGDEVIFTNSVSDNDPDNGKAATIVEQVPPTDPFMVIIARDKIGYEVKFSDGIRGLVYEDELHAAG